MEPGRVRPLTEADLDLVIQKAGGTRAHPDADRREKKGADYRLGSALIELKLLDDEGFAKPERQHKLAALFRAHAPRRPVIVLDRSLLPTPDQVRFDRIIEGPIKSAITKARQQLKQSRLEQRDVTCSVLLIINNGYTTLSHDVLVKIVANRVRNDTKEIDTVIIAGAYYHSDGFDSYFLWPIDCIQINLERPFAEFELLRKGWNDLADCFMTNMVRGDLGPALDKGPVVDTQFDLDGVTYVRPAPAIGGVSTFHPYGRPRKDSSALIQCPPVGTSFPLLTRAQWSILNDSLGGPPILLGTYQAWCTEQALALNSGRPLRPLVLIPVLAADWAAWCEAERVPESAHSIFEYANQRFCYEVRKKVSDARERRPNMILPPRYILVVTEVIGQDRANDVSHIALVQERLDGNPLVRPLVEDVRIFHEHALALAAAYAIREKLDFVLWSKDLSHAWI
jgi:hypothetical protein